MTTCDPIELRCRSSLSSMLKLLLFLVMQGLAVTPGRVCGIIPEL